ncbi:hypothetical protein ZWY2020_014632, partial [Hordeum vulgare]
LLWCRNRRQRVRCHGLVSELLRRLQRPKLSFLKVWGCDAYVKKLQPEELEPKAEKCI